MNDEEIFDNDNKGIPEELWKDYHAYRQYSLELMSKARQDERKRILETLKDAYNIDDYPTKMEILRNLIKELENETI